MVGFFGLKEKCCACGDQLDISSKLALVCINPMQKGNYILGVEIYIASSERCMDVKIKFDQHLKKAEKGGKLRRCLETESDKNCGVKKDGQTWRNMTLVKDETSPKNVSAVSCFPM